jgi:6-phosphofructokinase 1
MDALGLSALVSLDGDGWLTIAQPMHEHGIPIVGVPKTIDNDLAGQDDDVWIRVGVRVRD